MSDSVRPHKWQPTRLLCLWDSPGKNTGVGCHFLLQCMKVKSESKVAQLCPTLRDPMDCSPPGSSIHRIFQARVLEWGAVAFSNMWPTKPLVLYIKILLFPDLDNINNSVLQKKKYFHDQITWGTKLLVPQIAVTVLTQQTGFSSLL